MKNKISKLFFDDKKAEGWMAFWMCFFLIVVFVPAIIQGCALFQNVHPKAQVVLARSTYTHTLNALVVLRQNGTINDEDFVKIDKIRLRAAQKLVLLEHLSENELDTSNFDATMITFTVILNELISWQTRKDPP